MRKLVCVCVLGASLILVAGAPGLSIKYPFFNETPELDLNRDALKTGAKQGHRLRLVNDESGQVGTVFTKRKVLATTRSFKTKFRFQMHNGSGLPADGMAFVLQSGPSDVVGDGGGGLGYGGIGGSLFSKSLAVEFDLYLNAEGDDPNNNHVAVHREGNAGDLLASGTPDFDLYGGTRWVWIAYSKAAKKLRVFVNEASTKPATPLVTFKRKLSGILPDTVRVGFTAATGGDFAEMDVLSWSLKQKRRRR